MTSKAALQSWRMFRLSLTLPPKWTESLSASEAFIETCSDVNAVGTHGGEPASAEAPSLPERVLTGPEP